MSQLNCAGNALLDVTAFIGDDFLKPYGILPGSTNHVDHELLDKILHGVSDPLRMAGGGAANAAKVFSALGGASAFAGSLGRDEEAYRYRLDMDKAGVGFYPQANEGSTGVFCVLLQPDATRTVVVSPGVAPLLDPLALPESFFKAGSVLHIDGFLAGDLDRFKSLIQRAVTAGVGISFDVGGKGIATKNRGYFVEVIQKYASWVFLNEDEYCVIAGGGVDESLLKFSSTTNATLIVKRAEVGAVCFSSGTLVQSPVRRIVPLDETGAGDAFAAGFLFAAQQGASLAQCMRLANRVAEHIIQVPGLNFQREILRPLPTELF